MSKTQRSKRAMLVLILITTLSGCALASATGPGIADSSEPASPLSSQMSQWRSELADFHWSPIWSPIVIGGGITLAVLTLIIGGIIIGQSRIDQEAEPNVYREAEPPIAEEFLVGRGAKSHRYEAEQNQKAEPPKVAEFLVGLFAKSPRYRNGLLQNLEEEFESNLAKGVTVGRARRNYWAAALNSIGPQLLAAAKRIGIIGLIADYARRLLQ
jgi:hypothetical protein